MYYVTWDQQTGGISLHSRKVEDSIGVSPRPVFFEELDLLGLDKLGWSYPHCEEPLLWAVNKQYWYRGEFVFEAKGASIYRDAKIEFQPGKEKLTLKRIDMEKMLKRCSEYMFLLESEAIEFIRETYLQYASAKRSVDRVPSNQINYDDLVKNVEKKTKTKMAIVREDCDSFDIMPFDKAEKEGKKVYQTTKIDRFLASFSGGKDSQVVLDLCTRAIPSTDFEVVYSDTGYELPPSLKLYKEIQQHYQSLYPDLKFSLAKNHASVLSYWDKIGTPSNKHRWCCAVMKTAPIYKMFKTEGNKQAKILTFDGVRAEESTRRSNYGRIGKGVKHDTVINARPILNWSTAEVFLYLWRHNLHINEAYRQGMTRVGCLICPFGSEWNEMIAQEKYKEPLSPFLSRVEHYAKKSGIKDVEYYISEGGWKRRGSGDLVDRDCFIEFKNSSPTFKAKIIRPKIPITSFLQTLGNYALTTKGNVTNGDLKVKDNIYSFTIRNAGQNVYEFELDNICDLELVGELKKVRPVRVDMTEF